MLTEKDIASAYVHKFGCRYIGRVLKLNNRSAVVRFKAANGRRYECRLPLDAIQGGSSQVFALITKRRMTISFDNLDGRRLVRFDGRVLDLVDDWRPPAKIHEESMSTRE